MVSINIFFLLCIHVPFGGTVIKYAEFDELFGNILI